MPNGSRRGPPTTQAHPRRGPPTTQAHPRARARWARCLPASSPGWPGRDTQRVREEGRRSRPTSGSPVISLRRRLHGFPRENKKCLAPGSPHPTHELFRSQTQRIACRAPRVCARRTADSHPRRPSCSLSARLLRDPYRSTYPRMYCIRLDSHIFSIKSDTKRLFCTWLLRIILSLCKIAKCLIMDLDFLRNQCDTADKEILSVKQTQLYLKCQTPFLLLSRHCRSSPTVQPVVPASHKASASLPHHAQCHSDGNVCLHRGNVASKTSYKELRVQELSFF